MRQSKLPAWRIFIGSGLIALCIAWVSGTAAKVASAKPVLALRYG
jgi:hypothetical protein